MCEFDWLFVVVRGYMLRASRGGAKVGDTVYLIANQWFYKWKKLTGYNVCYDVIVCMRVCACACVCVCVRVRACVRA